MSPTPRELEEFAEDCVRLAGQADTPELRAKLLNLAREWMQSAILFETRIEARCTKLDSKADQIIAWSNSHAARSKHEAAQHCRIAEAPEPSSSKDRPSKRWRRT